MPSRKRRILFGVFIVSLASLVILSSSPVTPVQAAETAPVAKMIPTAGTVNVTIFVDYQCNACAFENDLVKKIQQKYGQNVNIITRQFPLPDHQNAFRAAEAAEAAAAQGKFWEMHDQLLENQASWANLPDPDDYFLGLAKDLGLDTQKIQSDLDNHTYQDKINADQELAQKAKISGVPSVVVNDKNEGYLESFDEFDQKVTTALEGKSWLEQLIDLIRSAGNIGGLVLVGLIALILILKYHPKLAPLIITVVEETRHKLRREEEDRKEK